MRLVINPAHPQPRKIHKAVESLRRGGVIAYPTDTIYGFGCDITNKKALERIHQLKKMSKNHLLSFVCPDLRNISRYGYVDDRAYRFIRSLVPGPYTFVLTATREVPKSLMMKRKTVGVRIPDHPVPIMLAEELGKPLLSTSVVIDDEVFFDPAEIDRRFPSLDMVLDADAGGTEPSTVIDLTSEQPVLVRQGAGPTDFL